MHSVLVRIGWWLAFAGTASAQGSVPSHAGQPARFVCEAATRVADPKLVGGAATFSVSLAPLAARAEAVAEIRAGGELVTRFWSGTLSGRAGPLKLGWDGRDASGARCPTGSYEVRLVAPGLEPLVLPLDLVRLGVTEIEAHDSRPGIDDEFQMVYFKKGAAYEFFATPAIHEYVNRAAPGEVSDLDLDDGEPRRALPVHTDTAEPVLAGGDYASTGYNYPLAFVQGVDPLLELTFGDSATDALGRPMAAGYPVAGCELRVLCEGGLPFPQDPLTPGGTARVRLARLPLGVGRTDLALVLRFQVRAQDEPVWRAIPGSLTIPLRVYRLLGAPRFRSGAVGTQYAGPWVEVAEYLASWQETLELTALDQQALTEVFVRGFFGQNGGLPTAIEGVVYDAFPLGGDGGATHYLTGSGSMNLARLLDGHALGRFVNCSDNMGAATTMLSMLGATNVRPLRLGRMNLRALWGIGAPGYTLNLWGSGQHAFSYHHIVTDDGGQSVSDTCMQLDEDGVPTVLPSTPGWNVRRPWAGPGGYNDLAASNSVVRTVEALPGLR